MKKKRLVTAVILLLVISGAVVFFTRSAKTQDAQWLTLNVTRGNVDVVVTATGTLAADTTVQIGTQVSGTISRLFADWNSHVRQGQTIAMLDTTFLWAAVQQADANLRKAEVAADLAKTTLDRVKKLYAKNLDSQSDYDTALSNYQTAQASVGIAQTALDQAKINLGYATIKSPITGVVISRNVDIGQTVASSFSTPTLFTIANNLSDMQVQASVDEGDIGNVKVGEKVTFTVDAYPNDVFKGKVTQIRLQPSTVQNVVEYTVIIDVPNPDLKLLPGMTANLTIEVAQAKDVLKVPTTALRFMPPSQYMAQLAKAIPDSVRERFRQRFQKFHGQNGGGDFAGAGNRGPGQPGGGMNYQDRDLTPGSYFIVWVLDGKQIKPVRVQIGLSDGTNTQVEGNLKPGEPVIVGMLSSGAGNQAQSNPFMARRRF
ncbi:MAG: efflux RND transporter periplasmic adaptor subunit [Bacteroidetes bacterium]|nr:efflux RND transporter periplasmic adaptor subunit [Bacteroidota bacterium]